MSTECLNLHWVKSPVQEIRPLQLKRLCTSVKVKSNQPVSQIDILLSAQTSISIVVAGRRHSSYTLFFLQRFAYVNDSANINHTWRPNKSLLCEPLGPLSEKQRLRQDTGEEAEKKLSAWWLSLCNLNKNKCSKGCQCCELRLIGLSVTMGHPEYRWLIKRYPHLTYEIHCFTKL